ncbi:hypothetical protein MASR1M6_38090 [Rubrivivax sp.]
MSKFPSDDTASWLGLCPSAKITGGKVASGKTARVANRASQALKLAAAALRTSQPALGAYYRRLCARMDKPKAVTAAAHKLARLIYAMLTRGEEYTDRGQAYYEERYRQRVVANLARRAQQLGLQVVPIAAPAKSVRRINYLEDFLRGRAAPARPCGSGAPCSVENLDALAQAAMKNGSVFMSSCTAVLESASTTHRPPLGTSVGSWRKEPATRT